MSYILQLQLLCASQTEPAYNLGRSPNSALTDFGLQPYVSLVCNLMVPDSIAM